MERRRPLDDARGALRAGERRRVIALASGCAVVLLAAGLLAQSARLAVERQGDRLHLSAPRFHFLEGRPLEQLHDGAAVPFVFTVDVEPVEGGSRWVRLQQRFVVSYDLWEEKFSVVLERPRRTASHLAAQAAEAWCLDNLLPDVPPAPPEKTFVVKLTCSVVPDEEPPSGEGFTLSTLIDIFSRRGTAAPPHWELRSGPLRLVDLRDESRR